MGSGKPWTRRIEEAKGVRVGSSSAARVLERALVGTAVRSKVKRKRLGPGDHGVPASAVASLDA